jgi:four helix bundle protein
MGAMAKAISSYRDLIVYQKAFQLQQRVFEASKSFPREETYALTDQIRRSSRSIGANIAEAWQKRRYSAHFVSKLSDAAAEQAETEHWLRTSKVCGYLSEPQFAEPVSLCTEIGSLLGAMMMNPGKWCR